jgi:hypothetical protein
MEKQDEIIDFLQAYRSNNISVIIKFLQQKQILHKDRQCVCGHSLKLVPRTDVPGI